MQDLIVFIHSIAHSTWIRTDAILWVLVRSSSVNYPVLFHIGGTFNVMLGGKIISSMMKPLSAMILLPTSSSF